MGSVQGWWLIAASVAALRRVAAGGWLGRMIGYGRLGRVASGRGLQLRMVPGHPDGAAGLKPIGDFYLYQSLVASLPAAFLGCWVLVLSLGRRIPGVGHYRPFLDQYRWLLLLAILVGVLVFVLPLLSVHGMMKSHKEETLLAEADRLVPQIEDARSRLDAPEAVEQDAAERRLAALIKRYHELEAVPTWPVDTSIRRRFTLRNLSLLMPFAGFLISNWQHISRLFNGVPR